MTGGLISRSMCQRMTIIVLITRASMRHLINAEGEGCGKSTNELLMMTDPSESEGEEITVIKHLIFLMSDSVAFVCPCLSPPVSSSWKISLRSSYPPLCSPLSASVPCPPCVKNKERPPMGNERAAEGQRDIWVWYFHRQPKCLVSTNLLPGNRRGQKTEQYRQATKNDGSWKKDKGGE